MMSDGVNTCAIVKFNVEINPGITLATAKTPIALGPTNILATNKSMPLVKIFPIDEIVFHMPEDINVLIEGQEKSRNLALRLGRSVDLNSSLIADPTTAPTKEAIPTRLTEGGSHANNARIRINLKTDCNHFPENV